MNADFGGFLVAYEHRKQNRTGDWVDGRRGSARSASTGRSGRARPLHGRDRTRGEQLLDEIRAANRGSAAFLPADFSSLAEVRRLADTVRQECDRLDILINNAGIGSGGSGGKR